MVTDKVCNRCRNSRPLSSFGMRTTQAYKRTCLDCESLSKCSDYIAIKASSNPLAKLTSLVTDHASFHNNRSSDEVYLATSTVRAFSGETLCAVDMSCPKPNFVNGGDTLVLMIPTDFVWVGDNPAKQIESGISSAFSYPEVTNFVSKNNIDSVLLRSSHECSYQDAAGIFHHAFGEFKTVHRIVVYSNLPLSHKTTYDRIDEKNLAVGMKVYIKQFDVTGTIVDFATSGTKKKAKILFDTTRNRLDMELETDMLYRTVQPLDGYHQHDVLAKLKACGMQRSRARGVPYMNAFDGYDYYSAPDNVAVEITAQDDANNEIVYHTSSVTIDGFVLRDRILGRVFDLKDIIDIRNI